MSLQPQWREVHAHRRALAQDRVGAVARSRCEQFRPEAQRVVGRVPHAEHPLVAAHRAHAAAHLVGQRLKRQPVIGRRQRAGDGVAGAFGLLHREEVVDGLLEPALQQVLVAFERDQSPRWRMPGLSGRWKRWMA